MLVVAEKDPEGLGQREDELPMRQGKQQVLIEVLGEQQGSLLAAGGAEEESLAREGAEVLVPAFSIGASDTGHSLTVVSAAEETRRYLGDPLYTEVTKLLC